MDTASQNSTGPSFPPSGRSDMHTLLIGIDSYSGVKPLKGCVNDIDVIQRILIDRLGLQRARIRRLASPHDGTEHETDVPGSPATRENIVAALRELGSERVTSEDRVFIYYAGHGAGLTVKHNDVLAAREALLPVDAGRDENGSPKNYLFDTEVNALLQRIAGRTKKVTVILDCCHSAGAARELDEQGGAHRSVVFAEPVELANLNLDAFTGDAVASLGGSVADCQIVAACLADEVAAECPTADGKMHGLLTQKLVSILGDIDNADLPMLRWGRIWRQLVAQLSETKPQHAALLGSYARSVFGGEPQTGDTGYGVKQNKDQYLLDVGELAGVTPGALVAIYGPDPAQFHPLKTDADKEADKKERVGMLSVVSAKRSSSVAVAVAEPFKLPQGARGRLVEAGGPARLVVSIEPRNESLVQQIQASKLLRLAEGKERAVASLVGCRDGSWALTDDLHGTGEVEGEPVLVRIPPERLDSAAAVLEHYRRYSAPIRMSELCTDLQGQLKLEVIDLNHAELTADRRHVAVREQTPDAPLRLMGTRGSYALTSTDRVAFRVTNTSANKLKVFLFECAPEGYAKKQGEEMVSPGETHVFWMRNDLGRFFQFQPPQGQTSAIERIVVIGTDKKNMVLETKDAALETKDAALDYMDMDPKQDFKYALDPDMRGALGDVDNHEPSTESWTTARSTLIVRKA